MVSGSAPRRTVEEIYCGQWGKILDGQRRSSMAAVQGGGEDTTIWQQEICFITGLNRDPLRLSAGSLVLHHFCRQERAGVVSIGV